MAFIRRSFAMLQTLWLAILAVSVGAIPPSPDSLSTGITIIADNDLQGEFGLFGIMGPLINASKVSIVRLPIPV